MSPTTIIISLGMFFGILLMVFSFVRITITPLQIWLSAITLGVIFLFSLLYFSLRRKNKIEKKDNMGEALRYALEWAEKTLSTKIDFDTGRASARYYPPDTEEFIGVVMKRVPEDPRSAGQPIVIVMGTEPLRVLHIDDRPTDPELLHDPFIFFSATYTGSPTPKAKPELDAGLYKESLKGRKGPFVNVQTGQPPGNPLFQPQEKEEP